MYGVDQQIKKIEENTKNFLEGLAFNHGLLWGVRGSGKSSIIRGILKNYAHKYDNFETLEINSEDLSDLPNIFLNYKDNIPIFVDTHHTSPNGNLIVASEILTNIEKFND